MVKVYRKAQSLPLNTIVIALLVVIVLVVVVLAFTSNIGTTNQTLSDANACSSDNSAITVIYDVEKYEIASNPGSCESGSTRIPGVNAGEGNVCCATPKPETTSGDTTGNP